MNNSGNGKKKALKAAFVALSMTASTAHTDHGENSHIQPQINDEPQQLVLDSETKKLFGEILKRAVNDIEFRELMLTNPKKALSSYKLTSQQAELIGRMKRVSLEEAGVDISLARMALRDNGYST